MEQEHPHKTRLRALRKLTGKTQEQVAAELGLNPKSLSTYETGRVDMSCETLVLLADYYGVSCDEVLGREGASEDQTLLIPASDAQATYVDLFTRLAPNHRAAVIELMRGCVKGRP